jgi:hypothetical protein
MWDTDREQGLLLFAPTTTALAVNKRVKETSRITVQLKSLSEPTNFSTQISEFLAYGGSS